MNKLILSISFCYHDSAVTISDGDSILLHLEAERVFREKHKKISTILEADYLVKTALEYVNKNIDDVEEVLVTKWENIYPPKEAIICGRKFKYELSDHHNNHIGVVLPNSTDKCVIYVSDGGSENGTTKVYFKDKEKIYLKEDLDNVNFTGMFYGTVAQLIINPDFDEAHTSGVGKLMGLSSLGNYSKKYEKLIMENINDLNKLNLDGIDYLRDRFGLSNNYNDIWKDKDRLDFACTANTLWVNNNAKYLKKYNSYSRNICMTGGCALNIILNSKLLEDKIYDNVYTSPITTDAGQSLGAILYKYPNIKINYPFNGRSFGDIENINYDEIISDLLDNKIIAWYQGSSEIGARALGHRSFIGLPSSEENRIKLSEKIKGREPYRPVAAIVLEESVSKYFYQDYISPYMTFCSKVKDITKKEAKAIVHYDNTTRVQTINKEQNIYLYNLLKKMEEKGIPPIIMNSSLNVMGEPIVDTIDDAIKTFNKSKADVLYINGEKKENNYVYSSRRNGWSRKINSSKKNIKSI